MCPQECPTLLDPMDCSLPDSPVHGIFRVRILGWLLIGYSPIQNKKPKPKKENQLETGRKTPKQLRMKESSIWNQIGRKGK